MAKRLRNQGVLTMKTSGLRVKSGVKAGGIGAGNHNTSVKTSGLRVKSGVKAGGIGAGNHNTSVRGSR
jgi:hypothetical protein